MFSLVSLSAIASLVEAAMTVGHEYTAAAPALAKDASSLVTSGKAVVSDVSAVVGKIRAGHYADTESDIQRGFTDLGRAIAVVAKDVPAIAGLVTSTAKGLPSPSGVASVLATLGKL